MSEKTDSDGKEIFSQRDLRLAWFPKGELLKDPDKVYKFDFHKGFLTWYDWHKTPVRNGAHFTPVYYLIQVLKEEELDSDLLDCFFRRIPYINVMIDELEFLTKRYKWERFENIFDYYISKFENIITSICELFLLSLNYYQTYFYDETLTKVNRFEEIIILFGEDQNIPRTLQPIFINPSLDYTMYTYIRNITVHNPSKIKYMENKQNPLIYIDDIDYKRRFGIFKEYLEDLLKDYNGKKIPKTFVDISDPRFPHYFYKIKLTKKSTLNFEDTIVGIQMGMNDYVKKLLGELFHLQTKLFQKMLYLQNEDRFRKEQYQLD